MEKVKRICELEVGDIFRFFSARVIVDRIENGRLWFKYFDDRGWKTKQDSMGANSQQKVEVMENKKAA